MRERQRQRAPLEICYQADPVKEVEALGKKVIQLQANVNYHNVAMGFETQMGRRLLRDVDWVGGVEWYTHMGFQRDRDTGLGGVLQHG